MKNRPTAADLRTETRPPIITEADAKETGERFMGLPDRWYEPPGPKWRCKMGHISTRYLKSEAVGACVCLECGWNVWLTFPEDVETPPPAMNEDPVPVKKPIPPDACEKCEGTGYLYFPSRINPRVAATSGCSKCGGTGKKHEAPHR